MTVAGGLDDGARCPLDQFLLIHLEYPKYRCSWRYEKASRRRLDLLRKSMYEMFKHS